MYERTRAFLPPAGYEAQDKDVAYTGNSARVRHPKILGIDPGGIGGAGGGVRGRFFHQVTCADDFSSMVHV